MSPVRYPVAGKDIIAAFVADHALSDAEKFALRECFYHLQRDPIGYGQLSRQGMGLPEYIRHVDGTSITVAYSVMKSPPYENRRLLLIGIVRHES